MLRFGQGSDAWNRNISGEKTGKKKQYVHNVKLTKSIEVTKILLARRLLEAEVFLEKSKIVG